MKLSNRILHAIEFALGILFAGLTIYFVLRCGWNTFGLRYLTVLSAARLIGAVVVVLIVGAIGGYISYLFIKRYLSVSAFLLLIPLFFTAFLFGGLAYCRIATCAASITQDLSNWGKYDRGIASALQQEPFALFPLTESNGTPSEYEYAYVRMLFSEQVNICANEIVPDSKFQSILQTAQETYDTAQKANGIGAYNIVEQSQNGIQSVFRFGISEADYIRVLFDRETKEIRYELVCSW